MRNRRGNVHTRLAVGAALSRKLRNVEGQARSDRRPPRSLETPSLRMEVDVQWRSSVYSKDQGSSAVLVTYGAASSVSKGHLGFRYLAGVAFVA